jgi:2-oxoglutarate ferredoxin oxidoreductase subunit gamma
VKPGGWIFYNSSLIEREVKRDDVNVFKVAANEIADEVGSAKAANMVMLGAFVQKLGTIGLDTLSTRSLDAQMHGKSAQVMELNRKALKRGASLAE